MEFNEEYFRQDIGAPMGSGPVPPNANIFVAKYIDPNLLEIAQQFLKDGMCPLSFLKRFLVDLFAIWSGTTKDLHKFFQEINKIHTNIKFTMKHTTPEYEALEDKCSCQPENTIPFLDTLCKIQNGKIITDLHKKTTDRNLYLLTNSIHPQNVLKASHTVWH